MPTGVSHVGGAMLWLSLETASVRGPYPHPPHAVARHRSDLLPIGHLPAVPRGALMPAWSRSASANTKLCPKPAQLRSLFRRGPAERLFLLGRRRRTAA